jgi:hypothetical protein
VTYVLSYEVAAASKLDAITKAGTMLRTGVRLVEVQAAEEVRPGWWKVSMWVGEDA